MKTLIAYFSLDGNTKSIAEKLNWKLPNTHLHEIELVRSPIKSKFWRIIVYGFKATFYKDMAIKPSTLDMTEYDTVIIGAPVWMGKVPPPVKAFLNQYPLNGKKVAAFCSMNGEPNQFFDQLVNLSGADKFEAVLALVEPLQHLNKENFDKIDDFVKSLESTLRIQKAVA